MLFLSRLGFRFFPSLVILADDGIKSALFSLSVGWCNIRFCFGFVHLTGSFPLAKGCWDGLPHSELFSPPFLTDWFARESFLGFNGLAGSFTLVDCFWGCLAPIFDSVMDKEFLASCFLQRRWCFRISSSFLVKSLGLLKQLLASIFCNLDCPWFLAFGGHFSRSKMVSARDLCFLHSLLDDDMLLRVSLVEWDKSLLVSFEGDAGIVLTLFPMLRTETRGARPVW